VGHVQSVGEIDNCRFLAPELHWPENHGMDENFITRESDVYGMGMVAYEVSSHHHTSSGLKVKPHVNLLGPDWGYAVLRVRRCHYIGKGIRRGITATALRQDC